MNCIICNETFETYEELTRHLVKVHNFKINEVYNYYNFSIETREATCPICGTKFKLDSRQIKKWKEGISKGTGCCRKCGRKLMDIVFGNPSTWDSVKQKKKETNLKNWGVENVFQAKEIKEQAKKTNLKKYGVEYAIQSAEIIEKQKETNIEKYGVEHVSQREDIKKKKIQKRISKVNKDFQSLLQKNGIESELEFIVENSGFDLKVGNTLIEINPYYTHNVTVAPYFKGNKADLISSNYHEEKTDFAKKHGFNCIHIFDWDNKDKVISLLKKKEKIQGRKCNVKELDRKVVDEFLGKYHLQGANKGVKFACGLYYENELVEVMTFGKPRYNKNYEYELLRLCTKSGISVTGGANKLLKYFEEKVNPKSIISYCDLSKFNGDVYEKLGFKLLTQTEPAKHWFNPKTKRHITDNLLRQKGFDILHNTNYGKGTNNEELMKEYGYVEIYDCGQLVFTKEF